MSKRGDRPGYDFLRKAMPFIKPHMDPETLIEVEDALRCQGHFEIAIRTCAGDIRSREHNCIAIDLAVRGLDRNGERYDEPDRCLLIRVQTGMPPVVSIFTASNSHLREGLRLYLSDRAKAQCYKLLDKLRIDSSIHGNGEGAL